MTKKFKIEDVVEVIGAVPGAAIQVGCWHKVQAVTGDGYVLLEGIEGVWHPTQFELQRRTRADVDYRVGDRVRILSDMYGEEWLGMEGVVTEVILGDSWPILVRPEGSDSPAGYHDEELELISRYEPEIKNGTYWVTEVGHKSSPWTVTVKDEQAVWEAADGRTPTVGYSHLLEIKSGKHAEKFPGIKFHTEKPEPTIQEQLDGLGVKPEYVHRYLGSDVTYQFIGEGQVKIVGPYATFERAAEECDVESFEGGFFELVVPKELTDLEKFERAGLIGKRFRSEDWGLDYKVTQKGKVKARWSDRTRHTDNWQNVGNTYDELMGWLSDDELVKI